MRTLVIIPAYNEEDSLEKVIDDVERNASDVDYIIVNDCSTDASLSVLNRLNASYLNCSINLGIGGAVQAGYKYALENNYDIAIQLDGDGQHDASYINEMVALIKANEADVVIGSRFIDNEGFQSSVSRRTGIRILSGLIKLICGIKVKDVTSGYRAINSTMIKVFADNYTDDYPEPEAIVMSVLGGARVKEIPVRMRERTTGTSSINFRKSIYYMVKVSLAIIICRIGLSIRRN